MDHSGASEYHCPQGDLTSSQEVTFLDDSFIGPLRIPNPFGAKFPPRKRALGEFPDMSPMLGSQARRPTVLKVRSLSERARGVRISSAQSPAEKEGDGDVKEPRLPVDHQPFFSTGVEEGPGTASADRKEKRDEIMPAKSSTKVPCENSPPATELMPASDANQVANEDDGDVKEPRPPVDHQPFFSTNVQEGPGTASADPKEKRDEITPAKCSTKVPCEHSRSATELIPASDANQVANEDDDVELPMTLLEAIKLLTPEPGPRITKVDLLDILETKGINLNPQPTDPQPFLRIDAKGEQAAEKRDGSVSCIARVPCGEKELPAEPLPSSKLLPRVTEKTPVPWEDDEEPPMTLLEAIKLLTPEPRPKNTDMNILGILKVKGIDFRCDDGR